MPKPNQLSSQIDIVYSHLLGKDETKPVGEDNLPYRDEHNEGKWANGVTIASLAKECGVKPETMQVNLTKIRKTVLAASTECTKGKGKTAEKLSLAEVAAALKVDGKHEDQIAAAEKEGYTITSPGFLIPSFGRSGVKAPPLNLTKRF